MPTATAAARRRALTGPALRTFFRIASAWHLSEAEQMRLLGLHVVVQVRIKNGPGIVCRVCS